MPRTRSRFIAEEIVDYGRAHSSGPDEVQLALQDATQQRTARAAGMQIGDDQAVLMEISSRYGSSAGGGDRHVHRLFRPGGGPRDGAGGSPAVLRYERRVDRHRPGILESGRRLGPH